MSSQSTLIRELAEYALQKRGAQTEYDVSLELMGDRVNIQLPRASWGTFLDISKHGGRAYARFPVLPENREALIASCEEITESSWVERDGYSFIHVFLDGNLSIDRLHSFIDDAYDIAAAKLSETGRLCIDLAVSEEPEARIIEQLILHHDLAAHREEIRSLMRPALLLLTQATAQNEIPIGSTRIGGLPDLPSGVDWPTYHDGRSLAFLAQLNLAELSEVGTVLAGLPTTGLLSIFSVFGWVDEDEADPQTPDDGWEDQQGWTVVLHHGTGDLQRAEDPADVHVFPAAGVAAKLITSLPNHRLEPAVAALTWDEKIWDSFDEMQSDFRSIQMYRYLGNMDSLGSHHLLGGYALFQQEFPDRFVDAGLQMFFQLGTDCRTHMCWGDGGELTFYVDEAALQEGSCKRIICEFQCG
jgi:uncharacterized protein YwqG